MTTKICITCKQSYPLTAEYFTVDRSRADGFCPKCKQCRRKYDNTRYAQDAERRCANRRERYRNLSAEKRDQLKEQKRLYHEQNKERDNARNRLNYEEHKAERHLRAFHYREQRRAELADYTRQWIRANPAKRSEQKRRRRAMKLHAEQGPVPFDEKAQLSRQKGRCYYCQQSLSEYHVDHVIPLSRGGSNHPDNLVLACPACNLSKREKLPHEWIKGGRLL